MNLFLCCTVTNKKHTGKFLHTITGSDKNEKCNSQYIVDMCGNGSGRGECQCFGSSHYPDFDVNTAISGKTYKFTADKIIGNYVELIDLTSPGLFKVSLYWKAAAFIADNGAKPFEGRETGLGNEYGIYALYNASGTVSVDGRKSTFNFLPGSGSLEVWLDKGVITTYTAKTTNHAFDAVGNTDDILLATGTPVSGQGILDPSLSTCGDNRGNNCSSFGSETTFSLTDAGKSFFVSPAPFYPLAFQSGQLNNFDVSNRQNINGSLDVVFAVPEPTSVALLGLGLVGLGLSRRRNKKV